MAIRDPRPYSPWCGIDQGVYHLTPAEDLKYIDKEDYPEWREREEDCK